MAKRIRMSASSADSWETIWLYQEITRDLMIYIVGKNYPSFYEINALSIPPDILRFNDGDGIESTRKRSCQMSICAE